VPGVCQAVKEKPEFYFSECCLFAFAVVDLFGKEVGVILVLNLGEMGVTVAIPVCPHMAVREKDEERERKRLGGRVVCLAVTSFHLSYYF